MPAGVPLFICEPIVMEVFGDDRDFDLVEADLEKAFVKSIEISQKFCYQSYFFLGAIRRTNSLLLAFRRSLSDRDGQMTLTLIRLNLDTVARLYSLDWAHQTPDLSAEEFARRVFYGESIRSFKLRGGKEKATDKWLIEQIIPLADWIGDVYKKTSGAIHFSDFHIHQVFAQAKKQKMPDGSLKLLGLTSSPVDYDYGSERYREVRMAFLHVTMMVSLYVNDRCDYLDGL